MTPKINEEIEQLLLNQKKELIENRVKIKEQDPTTVPGWDSENTQDDDAAEREGKTRADALLAKTDENIKAVERALKKIEEGTYGICDICGKPIDPARLKMIPEAALCLEDKKNVE